MKAITVISAGIFIILSSFVLKHTPSPEQSLYDVKWSLKKIHHKNKVEGVTTRAFIKFNRDKQSANGNGGCNSFGGSFTIAGNSISISQIFSTKMYCDGIQQTENIFFSLLQTVNSYKIKDKSLFLLNGEKVLLEFKSE